MTDEELERYRNYPPVRWVVPNEVLEQGYQFASGGLVEGQYLVLPAEEREWRDSAHYKAYVRPTKTEEEQA